MTRRQTYSGVLKYFSPSLVSTPLFLIVSSASLSH